MKDEFLNRDLSQLEFNSRVLSQAEQANIPPLERLKYLCISSSNLDEFFEIRVAGLKEQEATFGFSKKSKENYYPAELLELITARTHQLVKKQYLVYNQKILPLLKSNNILFLDEKHWRPEQRRWLHNYFFRELLPVLSPVGLDPAHPFPNVLNKNLCFVISLEGTDAYGRQGRIAILQAPRTLPRIIRAPSKKNKNKFEFVLLSTIIESQIQSLFPGMNVTGFFQFRVTRNSDLFLDDEAVDNLRQALEGELRQRSLGNAVRLEVSENCPTEIVEILRQEFLLNQKEVYRCNGPVNLMRLNQVPDLINQENLKFQKFVSKIPKALRNSEDLFAVIKKSDILLHHPYESFQPVIDFLIKAARDNQVVSIKQTLYRTGADSPIVDALIEAARLGKEVTVIIELKARFDEQDNLDLATRLQNAGATVVYGVVGYKTHAKCILVVRREGKRLRKYVHLGTGNYHPVTANLYTDMGFFSSSAQITNDVQKIFTQITSAGRSLKLKRLFQSPFTLHSKFISLIKKEANHARAGLPAKIICKMNALTETKIASELYKASNAGVKIQLIVRGSCIIKPGVKGLSENISVRSVIGRFLEHTRIYFFQNNNNPLVFLSSADWMERNCFSRVEIAFPIDEPAIKSRIVNEGLKLYLRDNANAWKLENTGRYRIIKSRSKKLTSAQDDLLKKLTTNKS